MTLDADVLADIRARAEEAHVDETDWFAARELDGMWIQFRAADAIHIARCDPSTVLAMLDRIAELEAELAHRIESEKW